MGNLEELVNLSKQDIFQPLNKLGPNSPIFQSPLQSHVQSPPHTPHRIMANIDPPPNVNANQTNPPAWRAEHHLT